MIIVESEAVRTQESSSGIGYWRGMVKMREEGYS